MPRHTVVERADEPQRTEEHPSAASDRPGLARRIARAFSEPTLPSAIALVYFAIDLVTDIRAGLPATHVAMEVIGLCVALAVLVGVLRKR